MPLTVMLESFFTNHIRRECEDTVVYFLLSDLSEQNREFFEQYVAAHGSKIRYLNIGKEEFAGLPVKSYISRETYFRLLASELLPAEEHRVLWIDADTVINGNLKAFYNCDFEGSAVIACPHGELMKPVMIQNCAEIGITVPEQYFNAGVMLCNLDVWRTMKIRERIRGILDEKRSFKFPGQDLTNRIFNGKVKTADWEKYNCMTHSVLPDSIARLEQEAVIIHYVGRAKPWIFHDLPFNDIWDRYYLASPFGEQKLKRMSYSIARRLYERSTGANRADTKSGKEQMMREEKDS